MCLRVIIPGISTAVVAVERVRFLATVLGRTMRLRGTLRQHIATTLAAAALLAAAGVVAGFPVSLVIGITLGVAGILLMVTGRPLPDWVGALILFCACAPLATLATARAGVTIVTLAMLVLVVVPTIAIQLRAEKEPNGPEWG